MFHHYAILWGSLSAIGSLLSDSSHVSCALRHGMSRCLSSYFNLGRYRLCRLHYHFHLFPTPIPLCHGTSFCYGPHHRSCWLCWKWYQGWRSGHPGLHCPYAYDHWPRHLRVFPILHTCPLQLAHLTANVTEDIFMFIIFVVCAVIRYHITTIIGVGVNIRSICNMVILYIGRVSRGAFIGYGRTVIFSMVICNVTTMLLDFSPAFSFFAVIFCSIRRIIGGDFLLFAFNSHRINMMRYLISRWMEVILFIERLFILTHVYVSVFVFPRGQDRCRRSVKVWAGWLDRFVMG